MTSRAARRVAPSSEDALVLHGRELRRGSTLATTSRFSDEIWDLGPALHQASGGSPKLDFSHIPERNRLTIKRLCLAVLSGSIPATEDRPKVQTVIGIYYSMRRFTIWLEATNPGLRIADVSAQVLQDFDLALLNAERSTTGHQKVRANLSFLWRYRNALASDGLTFDPRLVFAAPPRSNRSRSGENSTQRIPEPVHTALLTWAMRFVDEFSIDILNAVEIWKQRSKDPERRAPFAAYEASSLVRAWLDAAMRNKRILPSIRGHVNLSAIARSAGCDVISVRPFKAEILEMAKELGTSEYVDLDVEVRGRLNGVPWVPGFRLNPSHPDSVTSMARLLQTASYIVIAFLSGMRDSEMKHLRKGSLEAVRDSAGKVMRWCVHSLAFKGEISESGTPAIWVVGAPAARAVEVLEKLLVASGSEANWLFAPLPTGPGKGSGGRFGNEALTTGATNMALNRFTDWVSRYCEEHEVQDSIPAVNGQPWNLTTRQFRRTLAWYIARRPGGTIAGAIAYRHHSIQMFEGYAGSSASGFRAEVEAEEALARGEHLLAMIDRHEHHGLSGPAANEAYGRLEAMQSGERFEGTVVTDPRRLLRILDKNGAAIHPGKYVTCVFDPARAKCLASTSAPDPSSCKPTSCQNVALTARNRATWRDELDHIRREINQRPALPPLLVTRLEARELAITKLLDEEDAHEPQG